MVEQNRPAPRDIGENPYSPRELADFRKRQMHLTQAQVAEKLGMKRADLGAIESGRLFPAGEDLPGFNMRYFSAMEAVILDHISDVNRTAERMGIRLTNRSPQDGPQS